MKRIYLDSASTTPLDKRVFRRVKRCLRLVTGNPSSVHAEGVYAHTALEQARTTCARIVQCKPNEVIFTSGGTESNNLALQGVIRTHLKQGKAIDALHVITTSIEAPSVQEVLYAYKEDGLVVSEIAPQEDGSIRVQDVVDAIRPETILVSVMHANNEIGTILPVGHIARAVHMVRKDICVHSDASQTPLFTSVLIESLGVDLLTLDGQKIYGPKGVGALIVRNGVTLEPLLYGGGQERGLRSGTENVALIDGFAAALEYADKERARNVLYVQDLRTYLMHTISALDSRIIINGTADKQLPNILNISLPWMDTEFLVIELDHKGFAVSSKSACKSTEAQSAVVYALYKDAVSAQTTLRISFGTHTKKRHLRVFIKTLQHFVARGR